MAHPLELSYNWRSQAFFASLAAAICVGALARGQVAGWASALVVVVFGADARPARSIKSLRHMALDHWSTSTS